jgi:WD40 repeat protein
VLLDRQGQPRVTDFGLAKQMQVDSGLTGTGQVLGTPSYMPPEQASGEMSAVGPRSDVYALGAILYCLLTGRPPFQAASPLDTLLLVLGQEPVPLRQLNGQVPHDLETIAHKCLEKDPLKRYSSARDLGRDLERWLNHEPILARRSSAWERCRKWVRRRPAWAATIAVSVLSLTGIVVALAISNHLIRVEEQNTLAEHANTLEEQRRTKAANRALTTQEAETREALERLKHASYARDMALAQSELEANNVDRAMQILNAAPVERRNWEWNYLEQLCHVEVRSFAPKSHGVRAIAYRPDGKHLAVGGGAIGFGPFIGDQELFLWNRASGDELPPFRTGKHRGAITGLAWTPDGTQLALSLWCLDDARDVLSTTGMREESCGRIEIWDVVRGRLLQSLMGHHSFVNGVALSRDGSLVASAGSDGIANVWQTATGVRSHRLEGHRGQIMAVAFSPSGDLLATAGQGPLDHWGSMTPNDFGEVKLWNLHSGKGSVPLGGHDQGVFALAFSPDGGLLASAGRDRIIKLWDTHSGRLLRSLFGHQDDVHGLAFSPDGTKLTSGSSDLTVRLWNPADGHQKTVFRGHREPVTAVAFDPDGRSIASCGSSEVKVWDTERRLDVVECQEPCDKVQQLEIAPDGRFVAVHREIAGERSQELRVFDGATGRSLFAWTGGWQKMPHDFWFSSDGKRLVFLEAKGSLTLKTHDPSTGKLDSSIVLAPSGFDLENFTPEQCTRSLDNRLLAACGPPFQDIIVWNLKTGQEASRLASAGAGRPQLQLSPDGRYLATIETLRLNRSNKQSGSASLRIAVWEIGSGKRLAQFPVPNLTAAATLVSPSGQYLTATSWQRKGVTVWDLHRQTEVTIPGLSSVSPRGLLFSSDSQRLLTTQQTGKVLELKSWSLPEVDRAVAMDNLSAERRSVHNRGDVQLSPDGRRVFTCGDGTLKIWDADQGQLLLTLRPAHSPMQLSAQGTHVACTGLQGTVRIWHAAIPAR